MFSTNFDFQIITYKALSSTDIFIYTNLGGIHLVLPEYLGFFKKIKLNNLLNNLKNTQQDSYVYLPFEKDDKKQEVFLKGLISSLQRNGFNVTLKENKK